MMGVTTPIVDSSFDFQKFPFDLNHINHLKEIVRDTGRVYRFKCQKV